MDSPRLEPPDEIPVIRPDLARPARVEPAPARAGGPRLALIAGLVALLAVAAGVLFVLPGLVSEREAGPEPAAQAPRARPERARDPVPDTASGRGERSTVPVAPVDAGQAAAAKVEAEEVLSAVLARKAALEAGRAPAWAPRDYPAALELLAGADGRFRDGDFTGARDGYRSVIERFDVLEASRPERLAAALAAGEEALAAGDGAAATREFDIALALDPASEAAALGARRAATIEQVLALVDTARGHERAGELDAARAALAEALSLDAHAEAVREELERVDGAIRERDFAVAMSAALDALGEGRLKAAASELRTAERLKPGAAEVRDARTRLAAADQLRRIEGHRRKAEGLAGEERWSEAAAAYASALSVDGALAFAVAGKARAEAMARLHQELERLSADPVRLAEREPLEKATRVLADAGGLAERGPLLREKIERLDALVRTASRPVEVLLISDGLTDVTVYRVGRLGTFESRQLSLRPGSYVAVGARPGFRDVRRAFSVVGGSAGPPVVIRCEERI